MRPQAVQTIGIHRDAKALLLGAAAALLVGCSTADLQADLKPAWSQAQGLVGSPYAHPAVVAAGMDLQAPWWDQMGQPELGQWIGAALSHNHDLKATLQRVAQAQAQAGVASAGRWPSVNLNAGSNQTRGASQAMRTLGTSSGTTREQLALQMGYEFDFWGRRAFSIESALQQIRSAEYGLAAFQMSLSAEVAASYFRVLALRERREITQKMLRLVNKNSDDIRKKMAMGEATQVMLSQQLMFEQSLLAQEQDLLLQQDQALHQLALLAGARPGHIQLAPASLQATRLPMPDTGLPADLLCRRPDLLQAQANLQAANADVAVARTLLLPNISLSLVAGLVSPSLRGLTSGESGFLQNGVSASQAIFDGGARKQGVTLSQARRQELVERYAGAILGALRDTENALVGVEKSTEKTKWLEANRQQAQQLASLMQDMLEKGGVDFVQMIQIQTTVYSAEDAAVSGSLERILSQIELYKALGGAAVAVADGCGSVGRRP